MKSRVKKENTSTLSLGTEYELNQAFFDQQKEELSQEKIDKKIEEVINPYFGAKIKDNQYFMLLNNELKDYTIFNNISYKLAYEDKPFSVGIIAPKLIKKNVDMLLLCLKNRGKILDILFDEDNNSLECWIKYNNDEKSHCYYLFPYDIGVEEI